MRVPVYRVFRVPAVHAPKADVLWKDDVVSRQSVTARDAKSLGLTGDDRYVVVEGSEAGIARALEGAEAERIYGRFRAQDEDAASGMGLLFGP